METSLAVVYSPDVDKNRYTTFKRVDEALYRATAELRRSATSGKGNMKR